MKGPILASFDESALMKGIRIGVGKAGTPVVAAAMAGGYVGAALRGYGNVVIIRERATSSGLRPQPNHPGEGTSRRSSVVRRSLKWVRPMPTA